MAEEKALIEVKDLKEYFYIRSGTSSIIAKDDVLDELRELAKRERPSVS